MRLIFSSARVRCIVEIFNMVQENKIQNIFWQDAFDNSIDSRFFYTSKDFSGEILIPAYENVEDRNGLNSERIIMQLAQEHLTQGRSIRPCFLDFQVALISLIST